MQRILKEIPLFFVVAFFFLTSSHCSVQTAWADLEGAGAAYLRGDYATAYQEFSKLAQEGSAEAQFNLGNLYYTGKGVPQSYAQALVWYRKAADQGIAFAQASLGVMYYKGQGVAHDYAEAFKWYQRAANQGDAKAQLNLGALYYRGDGVTQDYVQAYKWFNLSAEQGDQIAVQARDGVAEKMTPEQILEAKRLSKKWKPKKEPNQH